MNIVTCIKQVPASSEVEVDPETGVLKRDSDFVKMNPYDLYALEASFTLKEAFKDATIHTVTMGPPAASKVLEEALYMGADHGTLLSDIRFAGADVLATAHTISQWIATLEHVDVVVCGKQTTDGDTAQVGPEIAALLDWPHVPYVKAIVAADEESVTVKSAYEHHDETVKVSYPVLLTIDKGFGVPRLPSFRRKKTFANYAMSVVSLKDLQDQDPEHYGLRGSPTQVEAIFPPEKRQETTRFEGSGPELAETLLDILKERKML